ncbi:MAG: TetR/AcrR family transcriptional regulator, partial [Deinococcus sp.]|nr:TetR/AcrR family transcriptional regulator [Deinococcus sp.]
MTSSRRQRAKQDKQERIYAAAWELLCTQGYGATTVRQIADAAGVSVGTVMGYGGHTGDKGGLLRALFRRALAQRLAGPQPPAPGQSLSAYLDGVFAPFWEFYREQPELSSVFVQQVLYEQSAEERRADAEQVAALTGHLAAQLAAQQRSGQLRRDADPELLAQMLFALYMA